MIEILTKEDIALLSKKIDSLATLVQTKIEGSESRRRLLNTSEIASVLNCSQHTIRQKWKEWAKSGRYPIFKGPSGISAFEDELIKAIKRK